MGFSKVTKPINVQKLISGEDFAKKISALTSKEESVLQKVMKGEGYVPINPEVKMMESEAETARKTSLRDQAHQIHADTSLTDQEKASRIQQMIDDEKAYRSKTTNQPKRFNDAVADNYAGETTAQKAAASNDYWGSSIRRQNEYKKLGVGDKS